MASVSLFYKDGDCVVELGVESRKWQRVPGVIRLGAVAPATEV